jgi:hypothetical protein
MYMQTSLVELANAMAARPFKTLGFEQEELDAFMASTRKGFGDGDKHVYLNYRFWTAQKPE